MFGTEDHRPNLSCRDKWPRVRELVGAAAAGADNRIAAANFQAAYKHRTNLWAMPGN